MAMVQTLFTNVGYALTSSEVTVGNDSLVVFHATCASAFEVEIQAYNIASASWQTLELTTEAEVSVSRIFSSGVYSGQVYGYPKIRANLISASGIVTLSCFTVPSYSTNRTVVNFDRSHLDAFSRLRTSSPVALFDSQNTSGSQPLLWENSLTGDATATYSNNRASVSLATGTASGDIAIRQTRQYFRYQSGKSQNILMTGVVGSAVSNTTKRWGHFDANNGLFFEQDGDGLYIVRRSFVTGLAVDTRVEQANWNIDRLDGSGASGITLDITKSQIFTIDFEWLGTGSVRFGVFIDGTPYFCHQIRNANIIDSVYMSSPNLPVRFEIRNSDTSVGGTLEQICTAVMSEAGFEEDRGFLFSASTPIAGISASSGSRTSIVAIRPATNIYGNTNRITIVPESMSAVSSQTSLIELVYNPTLGGSPSWQKVDGHSGAEVSTTGVTITGGTVILSEHIGASQGNSRATITKSVISRLPIVRDINNANPIVLALVVTPAAGATINGAINWREQS
jgi:hypothetical protein